MKGLNSKLNIVKRYVKFFNQQDNFEVFKEELIEDVKASVFLSLSESIIQKYLEISNIDNKIVTPDDNRYLTKSEFTEFVGYVCMKLNSEVDALKIKPKMKLGSEKSNLSTSRLKK